VGSTFGCNHARPSGRVGLCAVGGCCGSFPTYFQAVKWARLECKSYKIPEPDIDFLDNRQADDVPLFFAFGQRVRSANVSRRLFALRGLVLPINSTAIPTLEMPRPEKARHAQPENRYPATTAEKLPQERKILSNGMMARRLRRRTWSC
jgi:hypothetical protein